MLRYFIRYKLQHDELWRGLRRGPAPSGTCASPSRGSLLTTTRSVLPRLHLGALGRYLLSHNKATR